MSQVITTIEMLINTEAFALSDYPACKLFFPFNDAVTEDVPTDLVLGISYSITLGGFVFDGTKGTSQAPALVLTGDTPGPNLGSTDDFVAVCAIDFPASTNEVIIATSTGVNSLKFKRHDVTGANAISDTNSDDTIFTGQTDVDANTQVVGMYSDRGNTLGGGADFYLAESDGSAIANAEDLAIAGGADAAIDMSADNLDMSGSAGIVVYGMAIFQFGTIPADVLSGISWMNAQWRAGNKVLYPPWKGLT